MSILKKENNADRNKLISLMQSASKGSYILCDENDFKDKELAQTYNALIDKFLKSGNETAISLNNSMEIIGNCNNVRTMLEIVERQKNNLNTVTDMVIDIAESISKCEEILNTISNNTDSAYKTSLISKKIMNETFSSVSQSYGAIIMAVDAMNGFSEKFEAIKDILKTVNNIADRTQILAVNAKIEASRSSDGKGFAVVAGEISQLSTDTQTSVSRMSKFLREILEAIEQLVNQFDDLKLLLSVSNDSAKETETSVIKMADNMQNVIEQTSILYNHMNMQNSATKSFTEHIVMVAKDADSLDSNCKQPGRDMYTISRSIDKVRTKYIKNQSCLSEKDLIDIYNTDHLIFTGRLYNMIEGFEELKLKNLNQPKNCKFGKWMQSLKDKEPLKAELFKQADYYHNALHEFATMCFNANKNGEKEKAFVFFEQAQKVCHSFSSELNRLKKSLQ